MSGGVIGTRPRWGAGQGGRWRLEIVRLLVLVPPLWPATAGDERVLAGYDFEEKPAFRWELPHRLNEISGLALTADGRLLAHGDEWAIISVLDPERGQIVKQFAFGNPVVSGDFEGIALVDGQIFLVTSDGVLYAGSEGSNGQHLPFTRYVTGAGRLCEVEGLAFEREDRSLVLACKMPRQRALRGRVSLLRWSLDRQALSPSPQTMVPLRAFAPGARNPAFHPSDLAIDPRTRHYLLLSAREHALAELTPEGQVVDLVRLRPSVHRQPEGLALTPDGDLFIADEGAGKHATLARYARVR